MIGSGTSGPSGPMGMVRLPLLDAASPAVDALRAVRASHLHGMISAEPGGYFLHRFGALAGAVRENPKLDLHAIGGTRIAVFPHAQLALDFTDEGFRRSLFPRLEMPGLRVIGAVHPVAPRMRQFLADRTEELFYAGGLAEPAGGARLGGSALVITRSVTLGSTLVVRSKAWFCPQNPDEEVWEDWEKPADGLCPNHHNVKLKEDA